MTGRCTVCRLPPALLAEVDQGLLRGEPARALASRLVTPTGRPLGRMALFRHLNECVPATLRRAREHDDLAHALDVVAQLRAMNTAALQVLEEARRAGDGDLALKAVDRVVRQLELVAKASGDVDERPQVNVVLATEWAQIQAVLLRTLEPYAEVRVAVAEALLDLERSGSGGGGGGGGGDRGRSN